MAAPSCWHCPVCVALVGPPGGPVPLRTAPAPAPPVPPSAIPAQPLCHWCHAPYKQPPLHLLCHPSTCAPHRNVDVLAAPAPLTSDWSSLVRQVSSVRDRCLILPLPPLQHPHALQQQTASLKRQTPARRQRTPAPLTLHTLHSVRKTMVGVQQRHRPLQSCLLALPPLQRVWCEAHSQGNESASHLVTPVSLMRVGGVVSCLKEKDAEI